MIANFIKENKRKIVQSGIVFMICGMLFTSSYSSNLKVNASEILKNPTGYYKIGFKDNVNLSNTLYRVFGRNTYGIVNITGYTKLNSNYIPFSLNASTVNGEGYIEGQKVNETFIDRYVNFVNTIERINEAGSARNTSLIESEEYQYIRDGKTIDGVEINPEEELDKIDKAFSGYNYKNYITSLKRFDNEKLFYSTRIFVSSITVIGDYKEFDSIDSRLKRNIDFDNSTITYKINLEKEKPFDIEAKPSDNPLDAVREQVKTLQPTMDYTVNNEVRF